MSQEFLKRVACPVALLLANDRAPFWPDGLEKLHANLLRARVFTMTGGHHLHMTNVDETVDAIKTLYKDSSFLKIQSKL